MPDAGRVVTGTAKGVRLQAPGSGTRPLTDRVKQALFAVLAADPDFDQRGPFLDLFAGSGAAGVEALSRGAQGAVFVERDPRACAVIRANLARAGLGGGRVVRANVLSFLESDPLPAGGPFAAVLADPPYDEPLLTPTLRLLGGRGRDWLTRDAIVVAKHFWRDPPATDIDGMHAFRARRFGETMLTFYRPHRVADNAAQEDP